MHNNIPVDMESVLAFVKVMFVFVRERVKLDTRDKGSFPSQAELINATIQAMKSIAIYAKEYGINSSNRDSVKFFAFAAVHFNKNLNVFLRPRGFRMEDETVYLACLDFIATTYPHVDFSKHPDIKNTTRILANIASDNSELAPYLYLKGVQETCICQSVAT